jgi:hypothetical protein
MSEHEVFQHGGVSFPLVVDSTRSSLRDSDPAVFFALEFIAHCIEKYAGDRIVHEARNADVGAITVPIGSTLPWDPAGYLTTSQFRFPMLALYRRSTEFADKTAIYRDDASALELAYILPPLTGAQFDAMIPLLNAVKGLVDHCVEKGWDPSFRPSGGDCADEVWSLKHAGLESIETRGASFGEFPGIEDIAFPAITFSVLIKERASVGDPTAVYQAFAGPNLHVDLKVPQEDVVEDVVNSTVVLDP